MKKKGRKGRKNVARVEEPLVSSTRATQSGVHHLKRLSVAEHGNNIPLCRFIECCSEKNTRYAWSQPKGREKIERWKGRREQTEVFLSNSFPIRLIFFKLPVEWEQLPLLGIHPLSVDLTPRVQNYLWILIEQILRELRRRLVDSFSPGGAGVRAGQVEEVSNHLRTWTVFIRPVDPYGGGLNLSLPISLFLKYFDF